MVNYLLEELTAIVRHFPIWLLLGSQDIKLRYRRSAIGPFWITLSMAITIYSMGFLYANLFHIRLKDYFPYLATGIICWNFLSSLISEGGNAFIESANYIKNQESYLSLFLMRVFYRNTIILLHNLLVFIPLILIFNFQLSWVLFLAIPGWFIIGINLILWGNILAIISTKYRDFQPIITTLIQILFFLTPIMWMPSLLAENYQWVIDYNPFNHFLNLIRAPLMNETVNLFTLFSVSLISIMGLFLYASCLKRYRHRIIFWI